MAGIFEIVDDLREAVDGIVKPVVETVHEDQHLVAPGLLGSRGDGCGEILSVDIVGRGRNEIAPRIARSCARPLHVPDLAHCVGRDGHGDGGIGQGVGSLAAKHLAWIGGRTAARGRHKQGNA